jgi:hypothetical protein
VRIHSIDGTHALNIASGVPTCFTSERCEESVGYIPVPEMDQVIPAFGLLKTTIKWLFSTRAVIP